MPTMRNSEIIGEKYAEAVTGIQEEWLQTVSTKWYDYVVGLPIHLQISYLIVVFHNQVFNGGFHQYFINGYGQFARETIHTLKVIGASRKAELLEQALSTVNLENYSDETFRRRLLEKTIPQLFSHDDLFEPLENLDNRYYADEKEDIEQLLANYLRSF